MLNGSAQPTIRTRFLTYIARHGEGRVSPPQTQDCLPDGAAERYLPEAFQLAADYIGKVSELTRGKDLVEHPDPELDKKIGEMKAEYIASGAGHAKARELSWQLLAQTPPALAGTYPTSVSPVEDGMFTVELGRLSIKSAILETGAIQERRATLFVDTTPQEAGVVFSFLDDMPGPRPEFLALAGGQPILALDLNPAHPAKAELPSLLTTLTDLNRRYVESGRKGDVEAQKDVCSEAQPLMVTLGDRYPRFHDYLGKEDWNDMLSVEDRGNGILVLNLERNEERAGQILLDLRPGLPGLHTARLPAPSRV